MSDRELPALPKIQTNVMTVGVDELVSILTDCHTHLSHVAKYLKELLPACDQIQEIRDSIQSRQVELNAHIHHPLATVTTLSPISPGTPLPAVPFAKPTDGTLEHWVYELQKSTWILREKLSKYHYSQSHLLNASHRTKKLTLLTSQVNRTWMNLILHLSLCISQSSQESAEKATGNVGKLAIATGAPDWNELKQDDAHILYLQGEKYFVGFGVSKSYEIAFKRYQAAAKLELPEASTMLGVMYENGFGTEKDMTSATHWYKIGAKQGSLDAMNHLGRLFQSGKGCEISYTAASEWYQRAAEKGHLDAITNYGYLLENGLGIVKNEKTAFEFYLKAADKGYARAQNAVGSCYYKGKGISQDYFQAILWYRKASEQGFIPSHNNLGICYEEGHGVGKDTAQAKLYYQKAAQGHHPSGTCNFAYMFLSENDHLKAFNQFHLAVALGSVDALYYLGSMYEAGIADSEGLFLKPDIFAAKRYYREAARKRHVKSILRLAAIYTIEDEINIAMQYLQTADTCPEAQNMLGELYELGKVPDLEGSTDASVAAEWYRKAMHAGHARATFNLGALYETGQGVHKDVEKAYKLYVEAAHRGSLDAKERLQELDNLE